MNTGYVNLAPIDGKQFDERGIWDFERLVWIALGLLILPTTVKYDTGDLWIMGAYLGGWSNWYWRNRRKSGFTDL